MVMKTEKHNRGSQCEANTILLKGFHSGLGFEWLSYLVSFCMEEGGRVGGGGIFLCIFKFFQIKNLN